MNGQPLVLVEAWLHPAARKRLEEGSRVVGRTSALAGDSALRLQIQGAIVSARWKVDGSVMDEYPALLVIARTGVGVDSVDLQAATTRGVAVVNTPDAPSLSTAEHAVSLMLALAKRHPAFGRIVRSGGSLQNQPPAMELMGKVVGLVGLGRVGTAAARICQQGFGMKVLAFDPFLARERATSLNITLCDNLDDLLRESDFVSLHLPATQQTRHLIDSHALAKMKPGAYLVNCSRGSLVDEAALREALQSGRLAGAGLDVFEPEPPSPTNPLLSMEQVVATPHSASYTDDARRNMGLAAVDQVLAVLGGRKPDNLVNEAAKSRDEEKAEEPCHRGNPSRKGEPYIRISPPAVLPAQLGELPSR